MNEIFDIISFFNTIQLILDKFCKEFLVLMKIGNKLNLTSFSNECNLITNLFWHL